ncbi:MAG: hypothetical protein ACOCTN_00450 [Candidatus Natronoplasma sp.]
MRKSGWFALLSIMSFSVLISTVPLYEYTLWGIDCGEYLYYTFQWVDTGGAYLSIDGWAKAYPYFPGMFILGGGFHILSGVDIIRSMVFVPVVLSAFSPLFVFLIVRKVMGDWRPGILSAFLFTTLPPLIYGYSHPRPETLGFFFMVLILSFITRSFEDREKMILPVFFALSSLIVTHHLSTYFFILIFFGGIALSKLWRRKRRYLDVFRIKLLTAFIVATMIYWVFYAVPFRENRIKDALIFPSFTVLAVPFIFLLILEILVIFRRKFDFSIPINLHKESLGSFMVFFLSGLMIVIPILVNIALGTLPVRDIELGYTVLLYLPIVFLSLFALGARKIIKALEEGPMIIGWFFFIVLSIIVGVIFNSDSLLPMRQITFLLFTVSLLFGIGLFHFHRVIFNPNGNPRKTLVLGVLIILLASSLVPLSFPSQERAGGYTEGIESEDMEAAFWASHSTEKKIATDHRLSGALFSAGNQNLTWRDGYDMYFSSDLDRALADLEANNVSYIMWDKEMQKGAAIELGSNPKPINKTLKNDYHENLYLVYRSEECVIYAVR